MGGGGTVGPELERAVTHSDYSRADIRHCVTSRNPPPASDRQFLTVSGLSLSLAILAGEFIQVRATASAHVIMLRVSRENASTAPSHSKRFLRNKYKRNEATYNIENIVQRTPVPDSFGECKIPVHCLHPILLNNNKSHSIFSVEKERI